MNSQTAIYILNAEPSAERVEELVDYTSDQFGGASLVGRVSQELPTGQPVHVTDQLSAKKRDTPNSYYVIVEPKE